VKLDKAKSWWYQLQDHIRLDRAEDVIVMDIDKEPGPYRTKEDGTPRAVLAYLSIGEAEEYRAYWPLVHERKAGDGVVLFENPDWPGNHAVKFWDNGWQALMKSRVLEAKAKGFTGIYLDKADVVWDIHQRLGDDYDFLLGQMAAFIIKLASWEPDLDIVLQNCEDLLERGDVCRVLAATAHEDVLYGDPVDGKRNPHGQIHERLAACRQFQGPRFAVEYLDFHRDVRRARTDLQFYGFVPLVRPLDRRLAA